MVDSRKKTSRLSLESHFWNQTCQETARDADVFRMFAVGKGFKATENCQHAFRAGVLFAFIAVVVRLFDACGVEIVLVAVGREVFTTRGRG